MKNLLESITKRGSIFALFGLLVLAATSLVLLTSSGPVVAQGESAPNDPFVLLLKGVYQPVVNAPENNLGLTKVNLNDGTYITTKIQAVTRIPGSTNEDNAVVGNFFVSVAKGLAAYDLPGGAIAMEFTAGGFPTQVSDGQGGVYKEGTFELTILEATGIYSSFVGGHNHMVDRLHVLPDGQGVDENCYCIISLPPNSLGLWWTSN